MKRSLPLLVCTLLAGTGAAAKERPTFRYTPRPDEERPVIVDATLGPQGSDFAMRLRFNKVPWGEECKTRCANATLLLDTDNSTQTGLQLTKGAAGNGADLAVIVQGMREVKEEGAAAETWLRVKIRALGNESHSIDDGELLTELTHRQDPERLQVDESTVFLLVDATSAVLPSARKVRVIYQPPGGKAIQATIPGMLSASAGSNVRIFKGGGGGNWGKAKGLETKSRPGDNG